MPATPETMAIARKMTRSCLMARTRRLSRMITAIYDDALRPFELKASQLNLLTAIAYAEPVRRNDLASAMDIEASTLTRNLNVMVSNGWVAEREDAADRRCKPVLVTAKGNALLVKSAKAWAAAQRNAATLLGSEGVGFLMKTTTHGSG